MCLLHSFGELWGGGGCLFNPGFSGFLPISYQPTSTTCLLCITLLSELSLSLVSQIHSVAVVQSASLLLLSWHPRPLRAL